MTRARIHHFGSTIPQALELEEGTPPEWLLCDYSDPSWTVTNVGAKKNCQIHFDVKLPNGRSLASYKNLYDGVRRVVYGVRTGPGATVASGDSQCVVAEALITLARWMIQNRIYRFDELTHVDMLEYAEAAAFGVHNILQTEDVLRAHLEILWTKTGLNGDEAVVERRRKAVEVFPVSWFKRTPVLNRRGTYRSAGLDGIGSTGHRSTLSQILDEYEEMCGFYQEPYVQRRKLSRALPEEDEETKVTDERLIRLIKPFDYLHRMRHYLEDAVHILPFSGRTLRAVAKEMGGRAVGRTGTIPRNIATTMVERSARWVLDYSDALLTLKDFGDNAFDHDPETAQKCLLARIRSHSNGPGGPGAPFPLIARSREQSLNGMPDLLTEALSLRQGMTLNTALAFLLIACVVVIAAFSARRASEVCGLEAGCISELRGHQWLRVFIHKTLQQHAHIPVPTLVGAAVSVLERLSARSRKASGTKFLMQYNRAGTDDHMGLNETGKPVMQLALNLRRFGYFLDVPATDEGERWVFRMHQFRRLFAIMYIRDYELGDFEALAHHLRHWNPEMTRRYCMEPEVGASITQAQTARTFRVLSEASLGVTTVSGEPELVLKIKEMRAEISQRVRVKSEFKFQRWLREYVHKTGAVVHAFPWGYTVDVLRNTESSCEEACTEPTDALDSEANLQFMTAALKYHRMTAQDSGQPAFLRSASAAFVSEFEGKFANAGMEISP